MTFSSSSDGEALGDTFNHYEAATPSYDKHQVGGYPTFAQFDDPRDMAEVEDAANPLLHFLQIASDDGLEWGENGIAHFFIRQDAVRRRAWSEGWFYTDCI